MLRTDADKDLSERVVDRLVSHHGWRTGSVMGRFFLQKAFVTAVGAKDALLFLDYRQDGIRLRGSYVSQDRNVLVPGPFPDMIEATADDEALHRQVDAWCASATRDIDASYARRLYVEFGVEPDRPEHSPVPTRICPTCAAA